MRGRWVAISGPPGRHQYRWLRSGADELRPGEVARFVTGREWEDLEDLADAAAQAREERARDA